MAGTVGVMAAPLLDRRLIYVTGKGGAGKTTVALALALAASDAGRRVCVVEVGGQARVAETYGRPAREDGGEQELSAGLWTLTIDPEAAVREWFSSLLSRPLADVLVRSGTFAAFARAAPGARELTAAAKIADLVADRRWSGAPPYDLAIVDAPSSGHGVGMLRAPATFAEIERAGPLGRQAASIRDLLADERRTGVVAVAEPAEMSVTEALELEAGIGAPVAAIVANGVLARRFTRAELAAVRRAADGAIGAVVELAAARVRAQQAELGRLRRGARAPVHTLPWLADGDVGPEAARRLAGRLARVLAG
jgi:anion-transporting  ArsA/GET3 family ATPase